MDCRSLPVLSDEELRSILDFNQRAICQSD
jgi:hypothetical protein